ncbi:hypothetical protein [Cellulomonas aerilata]|uniref:Uncharacterized protein n=1 Tax=Cellulomonas aerilata TaxID=515326 RepID=A0A512D958_9CELL|nr:hypothetical protein [Cellulomonas aerilata]GEO33018.1 hypothetical protein CAE01nite_07430 [Cellulomonas aerilata]
MLSVGVVVVVTVAAAAAVAIALRGRPLRRTATALRVAAAVATVVVAAAIWAPAWRDSGGFAAVLVGVPPGATAAAAAGRAGRRAPAVRWAAAVVMLGWSLVTALGLGGSFLAPSALMLAAAAVSARAGAHRVAGPGGDAPLRVSPGGG